MNFCVVTTINKPSKSIHELHKRFGKNLIVVGDQKTPANWSYKDTTFLPIQDQELMGFRELPYNHYARKNLGYLVAMKNRAQVIYDTDDDNIPNNKWFIRNIQVDANESIGGGWYNAYNVFSTEFIWPRGFSLKQLKKHPSCGLRKFRVSSIQQGLADGEPDVDAIWRLVLHKEHIFTKQKSIYIQPKTWCPFNSQSTWWFPQAYALMYLPVYATFRMTDIWRSFIAQRCLWELGQGVTFHSPSEVFQDRNEHDLIRDFKDEVDGYLNNDAIVEILSDLKLKQGQDYICENLLACYQAIVDKGIISVMEIDSVKRWIIQYGNVTRTL